MESWIQTLLWEKIVPGAEEDSNASGQSQVVVLRLKGILLPPKDNNDSSGKKRLVVQGVQDLYDIQEGFAHKETDINDKTSKIVLIGKNLDSDRLLASFKSWVHLDNAY